MLISPYPDLLPEVILFDGENISFDASLVLYIYIYIYIYIYTGCPRRNVPDFGRVFLMLSIPI